MSNETFSCGKWGLTKDQDDFQEHHGWWVQGLGSMIVGCFGFLMNSITLYILLQPKLKKIFFNKLLICLTIFDILFIINGVYESYRLNMAKTDYCSMQGYVLIFLYPFRQIVLCCSIYMTMMLAFERYLAVSKPITYRRSSIAASEHMRLLKHVMPVIMISVIYTIPAFLSFTIRSFPIPSEDAISERNGTMKEMLNSSLSNNDMIDLIYCVQPTELRLSKRFVLWYINIASFVVTGAIPIICLTVLNIRIFLIIRISMKNRERLNVSIRGGNRRNQHQKRRRRSEEIRQAMILFGVVIVFFICHILRIILDIEELISFENLNETIERAERNGKFCEGVQFWTMITTDISHFLIQVNASINFFIYCFLSRQFRNVLNEECKKFFTLVLLVRSFGLSEKNDIVDTRKESVTYATNISEGIYTSELDRNNKLGGKYSSGSETEEEIIELKELDLGHNNGKD